MNLRLVGTLFLSIATVGCFGEGALMPAGTGGQGEKADAGPVGADSGPVGGAAGKGTEAPAAPPALRPSGSS